LVAEDNAIEDTIYHLHRALNAGRLDLERFLRVGDPKSSGVQISLMSYPLQTTRILAEEQFMKRALIEKIHEGLPIGASIGSDWNFSF
jgi:ESCRT-I complex subunit TSG101